MDGKTNYGQKKGVDQLRDFVVYRLWSIHTNIHIHGGEN